MYYLFIILLCVFAFICTLIALIDYKQTFIAGISIATNFACWFALHNVEFFTFDTSGNIFWTSTHYHEFAWLFFGIGLIMFAYTFYAIKIIADDAEELNLWNNT